MASLAFIDGTVIQGLIVLNSPTYVFERWHGSLLVIAILSFSVIFQHIPCSATTHDRRLDPRPPHRGFLCDHYPALGFGTYEIPQRWFSRSFRILEVGARKAYLLWSASFRPYTLSLAWTLLCICPRKLAMLAWSCHGPPSRQSSSTASSDLSWSSPSASQLGEPHRYPRNAIPVTHSFSRSITRPAVTPVPRSW